MDQKRSVKKYFDSLSLDYQKAYEYDKSDPIRTYIFNERKKIVLSLIDQQSGRLLDIGCGPKVITEELLEKDFLVYNIDVSPAMIERATGALGDHKQKDKACFKVCDIEQLDFEDSYFDVVLCIGVIEYLRDYHKAIAIISKILKKDGIAIISMPNKRSIFNLIDDLLIGMALRIMPNLFNKHKSIRRHKIEMKRFVPSRFVRELKRYGLVKVAMKFHGYRLASFRRIFPKFWIFLSNAFKKSESFLPTPFLAIDCVIKFKKEADD